MGVEEKLRRMGGVATRAQLIACSSRRAVDRALRKGNIVRDGRGRYAVPEAQEAFRRANALSGVVSHRSAATHWGWEQKQPPREPDVTLRRSRNPASHRTAGVCPHWADLSPGDVADGVTTKSRTLVDCLRALSFDEALAIADSALRHEDVTPDGLRVLAAAMTGPGAARARAVAEAADRRADNPFESTLRAIALDVPGLSMEPQVPVQLPVTGTAYVDLADRRLGIVAEADSFAWHGSRSALWRDCRRYNRLVLRGWLVLRFAWEDVMFHPDYVRECLGEARRLVERRAQRRRQTRKAA